MIGVYIAKDGPQYGVGLHFEGEIQQINLIHDVGLTEYAEKKEPVGHDGYSEEILDVASEKLWSLNIKRDQTNLLAYRTMENSNHGPAIRKNTMRDANETMRPRQDPGADIDKFGVRRTLNETCKGPRSPIAPELSSMA